MAPVLLGGTVVARREAGHLPEGSCLEAGSSSGVARRTLAHISTNWFNAGRTCYSAR